jgi:hypothetical protein
VTYTKADIEKMAKQIRYDMSVTKTRIDELMTAVASLPIPQEPNANACEKCGVVPRGKSMAHHLLDVHGIEVPA